MVPFCGFEVALFQNGGFAENVYFATNIEVPAVDYLAVVLFFTRVYFFDVIFGIFDNYFMRLTVKFINYRDLISLPIFNPPGFESETFNVV